MYCSPFISPQKFDHRGRKTFEKMKKSLMLIVISSLHLVTFSLRPAAGKIEFDGIDHCLDVSSEEDFKRIRNQTRGTDFHYLYFKNTDMMPGGNHTEWALLDSTASLECHSQGHVTPTVRWIKTTVEEGTFIEEVDMPAAVSLTTGGDTLELANVVASDEGFYTCVVDSGPCSINFTYHLRVQKKELRPILDKSYPENQTAVLGSNITFECRLLTNESSQKLYWIKLADAEFSLEQPEELFPWKRDNHLENSHLGYREKGVTYINEDSLEMTLNNVTFENSGLYSCLAVSSYSYDFSSAWLTVKKLNESSTPGDFVVNPVSHQEQGDDSNCENLHFTDGSMLPGGTRVEVVHVMDKFVMACPAKGDSPLTYTWKRREKRKGTPLKDISRFGNHPPLIEDDKLELKSIVKDDKAYYTCIVGSGKCNISFTFYLIVQETPSKPVFDTRFPYNQTVSPGANVTMECRIDSKPTPYTSWIKHNDSENAEANMKKLKNQLPSDASVNIVAFIDHLFQPNTMQVVYEGDSRLKLYDVSFDDSGLYSCFSVNEKGSDFSSGWLSVVDTNVVELQVAPEPRAPNRIKSVLLPVLSVLIVVTLAAYVLRKCRYRKKKKRASQAARFAGSSSQFYRLISHRPLSYQGYKVPRFHDYGKGLPKDLIDDKWEFPRSRLELGDVLGEGAFGRVVKGEACKIVPGEETTTVAVKMLKDHSSEADRKALIAEMDYIKTFDKHCNVVSLLGCCSAEEPLLLIFEYAINGNLRDFLRLRRCREYYENVTQCSLKQLTHKDLVSFAYQTAKGMEFLANRKCVHRDLAARNILVDEAYTMKIADFGLARDLHYEDYYKKSSHGRVPIKWMSPEALFDRVYKTESDVWSFGVVMWEIMTLGGTPYPSVAIETMFEYLKSGKRMSRPCGCPQDVYDIMRSCWALKPEHRPSFTSLKIQLDVLLTMASNQEYLALEVPTMEFTLYEETKEIETGSTKARETSV
ncbi:fibroblast growth factor receptor 2-like isoform X2 [Ptychodera flava]|uniref:fibroblast growth factor receptor 2-like isoform X2 n=2 Tax=Ptychodera flava TaxID=63121 RepID=UPI003969F406